MLVMTPNTTKNIIAKTTDPSGQSDLHNFTFKSSDDNLLLASKTGPNTATLTSGSAQTQVDLTIVCTDTDQAFFETVKIDDTSIATFSVEFA